MSVVDFAADPPEVISAKIYTGPGAAPLVAAASAWDGLAAELNSAARAYQAAISELTGAEWLGPSSASASSAADPYIAWINTTAAQAEQTANQARAAAAAYEAAFTAVVPPPLIAANRALLAVLTVTNIFGQNASQIAGTEAQYAGYWAQDTTAVYRYAANSAAATVLAPFVQPQQNTNPSGTAAQGAAVAQSTGSSVVSNAQNTVSQAASSVSNALQSLAQGSSFDPVSWLDSLLNSYPVTTYETFNYDLTSGYQLFTEGTTFLACGLGLTAAPPIVTAMAHGVGAAQAAAAPIAGLADSVTPVTGSAGSAGTAVSAGLGGAGSVGGLSVPQSWASSAPAIASPEIRLASAGFPAASLEALPAAAAGAEGSFNGVPIMGNVINASSGRGADSRSGKKMRLGLGRHDITDDVPDWSASPGKHDIKGRYSERDQLNELRKVAADLAKERDVLKRSANLLINEAVNR